uniref:Uncharacterized protein n=1 Tax=Candidatus Methanogaster sp. ANME-2c ERB4 TaxID=2759911 RepID=A0A7G9YLE3_9EURY|nr:hypothetical protein IMBEDNDK_00037 [Methanosarcinales archaeon ANME-2c ERB4]
MKEIRSLIVRAFETIFDDFYDESTGIYPVLEYRLKDDIITYQPSNRKYWRYNPFLMLGVMYARFHIPDDVLRSYDGEIRRELDTFIEKLASEDTESLTSYTVGPLMVVFALAYETYNDEKYIDVVERILDASDFEIKINEDAFLLLGLSYIYEHIPKYREETVGKIEVLTNDILKHQNGRGLFVFGNISSKRHQNQMYTLWALNRAFKILNIGNTDPIQKNIEYTIENRMQENGGILWEDHIPFHLKIYHVLKRIRYWEYYFECHQCFFVHAVYGYSKLSSDKRYNNHAKLALEWIFGGNRFDLDLLEVSDLGVPHRIVDVSGNIHVKGQQFKGTYEIGGYLMALTDYAMWDII